MPITNWEITREDHDLLLQVADRAKRELEDYPDDKRTLIMDLNACHSNGCPLDFAGLLTASWGDLYHDLYGIRKFIDRDTGTLTDVCRHCKKAISTLPKYYCPRSPNHTHEPDIFMPRYALANHVPKSPGTAASIVASVDELKEPPEPHESVMTIDITPVGCQTPEGIARVNTAMKEFENVTAEVANAATQFISEHRMTLIDAISGTRPTDEDRAALRDDLHQLEALIGARRRKQEQFLRAVAGAPPMPEYAEKAAPQAEGESDE